MRSLLRTAHATWLPVYVACVWRVYDACVVQAPPLGVSGMRLVATDLDGTFMRVRVAVQCSTWLPDKLGAVSTY